jgi:hypothetical protein
MGLIYLALAEFSIKLAAIASNCYDIIRQSIMTPRKRRPGGGRKSTLHKVSTFSTRITAETREALEAEAVKSGISISQLAEKLLDDGLKDRRYRDFVSSPVRALALIIENIEQETKSDAADGRTCEWNSDPTVFEVFRLAIAKLLEKLQPPGDIDTSIEGPLIGRTPEERAEATFRRVWSSLLSAEPITQKQVSELIDQRGWRPLPRQAVAAISLGSYSAESVRKALNIKGKQESEK